MSGHFFFFLNMRNVLKHTKTIFLFLFFEKLSILYSKFLVNLNLEIFANQLRKFIPDNQFATGIKSKTVRARGWSHRGWEGGGVGGEISQEPRDLGRRNPAGDRYYPRRSFPLSLFPAVLSPLGLSPAGHFPARSFPRKKNKILDFSDFYFSSYEEKTLEQAIL